jgi:hypothetical protein
MPSKQVQPQSTVRDPSMCHKCQGRKRVSGMCYCPRCLAFMRFKVEQWAHEQNPVPGIDIREC